MKRFAASLLLAAGIIGLFVPRTVTSSGGQGSDATFAQRAGRLPVCPEAMKSERARSLEMDDFKVREVSDDTMASTPIMLKLNPPEVKPALHHANLPLRFGRSSPLAAAWMLQFLRSPETDSPIALPCHQCAIIGGVTSPTARLPRRFGRTNRFYSRPARTLAMFSRGIAAQLQSRSQVSGLRFLEEVREEDILNIQNDIEASNDPASE